MDRELSRSSCTYWWINYSITTQSTPWKPKEPAPWPKAKLWDQFGEGDACSDHGIANGMTEHFRTLLNKFGTHPYKQKKDSKARVTQWVPADNATTHDTTGFAEVYLVFIRPPSLPIELVLQSEESGSWRITQPDTGRHPSTEMSYRHFLTKTHSQTNTWRHGLREAKG